MYNIVFFYIHKSNDKASFNPIKIIGFTHIPFAGPATNRIESLLRLKQC